MNSGEKFDKYMKTSIQSFMAEKNQIEPSPGFTEKTMARVKQAALYHKIRFDVVIISLMFSPFLLRAVWLLVRNDYFSLVRLPFSHLVGLAYIFFLSSLATYVFLGIGTILTVSFFFGSSIISTTVSTSLLVSRTAGNIFRQAKYRA